MRLLAMGSVVRILVCCVVLVASADPDGDSCNSQLMNVESGEIMLPSALVENCEWIVSAPPGKKLLVNIRDIHLASENHTLIVSMDDSEYNVPRECEKCWTNMVGEILKVTFTASSTINVTENELFSESLSNDSYVSSFFIFYKSFDPWECETPEVLSNGYFLEKNWSKGSKIRYRCHQPYEIVGKELRTCVVLEDSPVPVWDGALPECAVPPCDGLIVNRTAGKGMIVHPGYPSKTILPNQKCQWNISTDSDRRIAVSIKNFGLPLGKGKQKGSRSFLEVTEGNGERVLLRLQGQMPSQLLITTTNQLTILLQTGETVFKSNDAGGLYGFTIEYEPTCPILHPPENGVFEASNFTIGSSLGVKCDPDFALDSETVVRCLAGAIWSSALPSCTYIYRPEMFTTMQFSTTSVLSNKGSKKTDIIHEQNAAEKEKEEKGSKENDVLLPGPNAVEENFDKEDEVKTLYKKSHPNEPPLDILTVALITLGIALPLLLLSASVGAYFWYRRRYPARMGFGRKFETFENPIYQKHKRMAGGNSSENPAELQRLTMLSSP